MSTTTKSYTTIIVGLMKKFMPKSAWFLSKLKLRQIDLFYKVYLYSSVCNRTLTRFKMNPNLHQKPWETRQKVIKQQNTLNSEQKSTPALKILLIHQMWWMWHLEGRSAICLTTLLWTLQGTRSPNLASTALHRRPLDHPSDGASYILKNQKYINDIT